MSLVEVQSPPELFRSVGTDGVEYIVRPFKWNYERAEQYHKEFLRYRIISDHVPKDLEGFLKTMFGSSAIWYEVVEVPTDRNVGFMYLTDFMPSMTEKRFLSATFHAITWDAKAAPRLGLAKEFIRQMFRQFKLHRLQAAAPLSKGGAIRMLHRIGFKDEGVMRQAISYGGQWYGVLLLSLLESEVLNGSATTG